MIKVCFLFALFTAVYAQDVEMNNKCTYTFNKRIFTCVGLEDYSKNVELHLVNGTNLLFIKDCKNVHLNKSFHSSKGFAKLKRYDILNTKTLRIDSFAFSGLDNVEYLHISGNIWSTVKENTFVGLDRMEILNIANNEIDKLYENSFNGLGNLRSLDLTGNKLFELPENGFNHLVNLESLYLNHNLLKRIEGNNFNGLSKLNLLILTNNSLEYVNMNAINKVAKLEYLYLDFNEIKVIDGELQTENLKFLQLNNNNLKRITENLFKKCKKLMSLDLSNNKLNSLHETPFTDLPKLKLLNLHNNSVNFSSFNTLKNNMLVIV